MDEPKWDQVHNDETLQHNLLISPCQTSDRSRFPADKRMIFVASATLLTSCDGLDLKKEGAHTWAVTIRACNAVTVSDIQN